MKYPLAQLATKGALWTSISQFSTQAFQFAVTVILARLLSPEDFGVVGMAGMFTGFVACFSNLGMNAAIIQRKDVSEGHLSTAFWSNIILAIVLCLSALFLSPLIANFFHKELVKPVISVVALGFILGALGAIQRSLLTKRLDFKRLAIVEMGIALAYGGAAIALACMGWGVWSLVYGGIFSDVAGTLFLWVVCPWRPKLLFRYGHFKELFGFGMYVAGQSTLSYIGSNADYLLIGRFLGPHALGVYTVAFTLMSFPQKRISNIITKVTFPLFSAIQDDNSRLRKGYLLSVKYISVVTFPITMGLMAAASEFIKSVYGAKWVEAILPLQIMCIAGMLRSIGTTAGTVLYAKRRARVGFFWNVLEMVVLTLALIIGVRYGIVGVAIAVTVTTVFLEPIIQWITNRFIELTFGEFLRALYPASLCSVVMVCALFLSRSVFSGILHIPDVPLLISSICIGAVVYLFVFTKYFKPLFHEMKGLFKP